MIRFFVDTNVFFDVFAKDRKSHVESTKIFKLAGVQSVELVLASISVMNALYSFRKAGHDMEVVIGRMNRLIPLLEFAPVDAPQLIRGLNSGWSDLEDAIQFQAALAAGSIDAIVSNDKDFKQQKQVPVLTPKEALKRLR